MSECNFKPYEGEEKYLFISYAHKDSDTVFRIMEGFMARGYRQWYDAGIDPGTEWPENIATHLQNSNVVVCCISENYINSQNCKREITFALSKNIPLLVIFLEEIELPPGLEMQLSSQQCTFYYKYKTDDAFFDKATAGDLLDNCLMPGYEKKASATVEEADTQYINSAVNVMSENNTAKKEPKKKVSGKTVAAIVVPIVSVLAVAAIIAIVAIVGSLMPVRLSSGTKIAKDKEYVSVYNEKLTRSDVKKITKLRKMKNLTLSGVEFVSSADLLGANKKLESLYLSECKGIDDFNFINNMKSLSYLTISDCGVNDNNIELAQDYNLVNITIHDKNFTDVTKIPVEYVSYLDISGTGVSDISSLSECDWMNSIDISDTKVTDITPIMEMESVRSIKANNCELQVPAVSALSSGMTDVYLDNCGLNTLSFLGRQPSLDELSVAGNNISDMAEFIADSNNLTKLNVSYNPIDTKTLEAISKSKRLTNLDISGIPMKDLSIVNDIRGLSYLYADNCCLEDISALDNIAELKTVHLNNNNIVDISPLTNMSQIDPRIQVANNMILEIPGFVDAEIAELYLHGNPLTSISMRSEIPQVRNMTIDYFEGIENIKINEFTTSASIYVVEVPEEKKESVKEALSKYGYISFVFKEEADEKIGK